MNRKTIIPRDIKDFLSLISILGFIAIFFQFTLNNAFLSENMTSVFLILGGTAVLISGKVFTIKQWMKDGIQSSEYVFLFAILFGFTSMIIGILLLFNVNIPSNIQGMVGIFALAPALFILIDYLNKDKIC